MRLRYLLLVILATAGISCSSSKKIQAFPSREDGLSYATAVTISESSEKKGVEAEYRWVREHFTDYTVTLQSLTNHDKKPFDVISIRFSDGREMKLYFDISRFFGKF